MDAVRGIVQQRADRSGRAIAAASFDGLRSPGGRSAVLPALLSACLLLTLAACATPQQRAARNQAEVERMMFEYGPACERLGYTPNGDGWRDCVLRLNARDDLQRYPAGPGFYDGGGPGWYGGGGWWRPIW